jgi:uncharacterized protein
MLLALILAACTAEDRCARFGRVQDCTAAALRAELGVDGAPKDPEKAKTLFAVACEKGGADSCLRLGADRELAKDPLGAAAFYQRACGLGAGQGCGQLALLHQSGAFDGFKAFGIAEAFHRHACELGWGKSCTTAGHLVSEGRGVARDLEEGRKLFAAGCKTDEEACTALERTRCEPDDVRRWTAECPLPAPDAAVDTTSDDDAKGDTAKGDTSLVVACEALGDCRLLGWGGVEKSADAARDAYRTACARGSRIACNALGILYEQGAFTGTPDHVEAARYYKDACFKRHWPGSCTAVGRIAEEELGDVERARRFYTVGCDAKFAPDCAALAALPPAPPAPEITEAKPLRRRR